MGNMEHCIADYDWERNCEDYCSLAYDIAVGILEPKAVELELELKLIKNWHVSKYTRDLDRSNYTDSEEKQQELERALTCVVEEVELPEWETVAYGEQDPIRSVIKRFLEGELQDSNRLNSCIQELQNELEEVQRHLQDVENSPYYDPWIYYKGHF